MVISGNDINRDVKAIEIALQVGKSCLLGTPQSIGPVLLRLGSILIGHGINAEVFLGQHLKERHEQIGLCREIRHLDLREHLLDEFTLDGIVVDKYHAIQSDVKFIGNGTDVGGLVLPVNAHRAEVLLLEHHVRVVLPGVEHVILIVLAAHGQDHSIAGELQQGALPIGIGFARIIATKPDAVDAVLT